jgi:glutamate synthase (NADPH/NADH) small chain
MLKQVQHDTLKVKHDFMRYRNPAKRIKDFKEVALGLTERQAVKEANRCLQCKKPKCIEGCPVGIDIPKFISFVKEKDYLGGLRVIREFNMLPSICGRVCPQETQCQGRCLAGKKASPVSIGALERFVADYEMSLGKIELPKVRQPNGHKVAVIGSGPSGLTVAADLAKSGYDVTVFEALHEPGGVLLYGIPEFRLPKRILQREINYVKNLGVKIILNWVIGRTQSVEELFDEGFEAVFIGVGAGSPRYLGIPGENLNNVYFASEFLTRVNLMKAHRFPEYDTPVKKARRVGVIGGGNVAMDSARTALRLDAEKVYIIYRRTEREVPSRREEIENAKEEGIEFYFLSDPKIILGDERGWVQAIKCEKMELGDSDESGRRKPEPTGEEFSIDVDQVIVAIGQRSNPILVRSIKKLKLWGDGYIAADREGRTNLKGVFAGGDITTGAATVISAMGAGKRAAKAIDDFIMNRTEVPPQPPEPVLSQKRLQ